MNGGAVPPGRAGTVFRPKTAQELSGLASALRASKTTVILRGSGEGPGWGRTGQPPSCSIVLADLAAEPGIEPLDLVASVDAGISVARLRATIQSRNLDLQLEDPPWTAATLGGLLARGEGRGAQVGPAGPRAVVLGIEAVLPDGRMIRSGGRTVKNVAGYDVHRLFVGSLGTLGAIARVHLKLVPLPPAAGSLRLEGGLALLLRRADQILSELPQIHSVAIDAAIEEDVSASMRISFSGPRGRVAFIRDRLLQIDRGFKETGDSLVSPTPLTRGALVRGLVRRTELVALATAWGDALRSAGAGGHVRIHPDAGECWLLLAAPCTPLLRETLRTACRCFGSFFEAWGTGQDGRAPWDPVPAAIPFWRKLRGCLDPDGLWNPGVLS